MHIRETGWSMKMCWWGTRWPQRVLPIAALLGRSGPWSCRLGLGSAWPCDHVTMWPWTRSFSALGLSFLACKMQGSLRFVSASRSYEFLSHRYFQMCAKIEGAILSACTSYQYPTDLVLSVPHPLSCPPVDYFKDLLSSVCISKGWL